MTLYVFGISAFVGFIFSGYGIASDSPAYKQLLNGLLWFFITFVLLTLLSVVACAPPWTHDLAN